MAAPQNGGAAIYGRRAMHDGRKCNSGDGNGKADKRFLSTFMFLQRVAWPGRWRNRASEVLRKSLTELQNQATVCVHPFLECGAIAPRLNEHRRANQTRPHRNDRGTHFRCAGSGSHALQGSQLMRPMPWPRSQTCRSPATSPSEPETVMSPSRIKSGKNVHRGKACHHVDTVLRPLRQGEERRPLLSSLKPLHFHA